MGKEFHVIAYVSDDVIPLIVLMDDNNPNTAWHIIWSSTYLIPVDSIHVLLVFARGTFG